MPSATRPIDRAVARQAAHWLMRLGAEDASDADRQACQRWRTEHPEHERAWQRAQAIGRQFGAVPAEIGLPTLGRATPQDARARRALLKTIALLATGVPLGLALTRSPQWQAWRADYHTATGETRELALPDGTRLALDTASAVDVDFDPHARRIVLRQGAILIDTAPDPRHPARPLEVLSPHGRIRPIGTRFTVRLHGEHSAVIVEQGSVAVRPTAHSGDLADTLVPAGQAIRFDALQTAPPAPARPHATAWSRGALHAADTPLGEFIAELSRYRPGILRCAPAVAALRVSGTFQLRDTDAVLATLAAHLPVQVRYRTRYWVSVEAQGRAE